MCFLILGSSHATSIRRELERRGWPAGRTPGEISAVGISGGRLECEAHRKRWVQTAATQRATTVLLLLGGNDLCQRDCDLPELARVLVGFGQELRAAGVVDIYMFPVLPCIKPRGVRHKTYRLRQEALNRIWASRFRRPPIIFVNWPVGAEMLGGDGVHLSPRGREVVMRVVKRWFVGEVSTPLRSARRWQLVNVLIYEIVSG